jgi:hypothetical protein
MFSEKEKTVKICVAGGPGMKKVSIADLKKSNHEEPKPRMKQEPNNIKKDLDDIMSFIGSLTFDSALTPGGIDFETKLPQFVNPMEARFVTRNKKGKTKTSFIEPKIYDINYPVKGYFNLEKSTTVLVFSDGSKVKTVSESNSRSKAHTGVIISLAKRILGPQSETDRNSIGALYNKFSSEAQAEAAMYGVVMSYFVSNGLVKDPATFDLWMVEFLTSKLVQMPGKEE